MKKFKKIIEKLPIIKEDKANHFIYGISIFLLTKIIFGPIVGLATCVSFGILKEVYDHFHPNHTCDVMDAIATIIGGIVGVLIILL